MKTGPVLLTGCISLLAAVACAFQSVPPTVVEVAPGAAQEEASGPTSASDAAGLSTAAPTATAAPTDIPTATPSPTPEPIPQWVWVWTANPAQLVALNTTGDVNVLMDAPEPESFIVNGPGLWQVASDKALTVYLLDGQFYAYLLTTTEAISLPLPPLQLEAPENVWQVIARSDPYVVIQHPYSSAEPAFLINTDTAEISLVANNVVDFDNAVTFSADNHYMRYVTTDANSGTDSHVVERDLTTGQERTLYSYSNFDHVYSDATGDLWFDVRTGDMIAADGRTSNSQRDVRANVFRWLVGDYFMTGDYACTQDCPLTLTPNFGDGPALTFTLPEKTENYGGTGWLLEDQSLLFYESGARKLWHLLADGSGEFLGYRAISDNFSFRSPADRLIQVGSSAEATTPSFLLDVHTGEQIQPPWGSVSMMDLPWADRYPGGMLWTLYRADNTSSYWLLPDDSDTFIPLPEVPTDAYCNVVLPDGNLACTEYHEASGVTTLALLDVTSDDLTDLYDQNVYSLSMPVP